MCNTDGNSPSIGLNLDIWAALRVCCTPEEKTIFSLGRVLGPYNPMIYKKLCGHFSISDCNQRYPTDIGNSSTQNTRLMLIYSNSLSETVQAFDV